MVFGECNVEGMQLGYSWGCGIHVDIHLDLWYCGVFFVRENVMIFFPFFERKVDRSD